jgi:N-glycosylase/DNA lyase
MTSVRSTKPNACFESTVRALCPIIEGQVRANSCANWTEYQLRKELVACILGSQVKYEMATAALGRLEDAGLLDDERWTTDEDQEFEDETLTILSKGYRFPKARAIQLTKARDALARQPLMNRLAQAFDPRDLREMLIADIAGVGPKQASMFLRNVGKSYELAILDTHVLNFMDKQNLLSRTNTSINTIKGYERTERVAIDYADYLGYPVGYLDWAIWATMRAARELGL